MGEQPLLGCCSDALSFSKAPVLEGGAQLAMEQYLAHFCICLFVSVIDLLSPCTLPKKVSGCMDLLGFSFPLALCSVPLLIICSLNSENELRFTFDYCKFCLKIKEGYLYCTRSFHRQRFAQCSLCS